MVALQPPLLPPLVQHKPRCINPEHDVERRRRQQMPVVTQNNLTSVHAF